jgi:hypothetical protein
LGRRIRELLAGYASRLGDAATDPTVHGDLARLCEVQAISEDMRSRLLRHERVDLVSLTRLENVRRRLATSLGVVGPPPPPKPMSFDEYVARLKVEEDAKRKAKRKP